MASYKNITVKKRGGGTRKQRVKVLASGKFQFVKNLTKRRKKASNPRPKKARKVTRKVARRKRRRGRRGMTIPLAPIAGLFAGMAEAIGTAMAGDYEKAMNQVCAHYTGYWPPDRTWNVEWLKRGLLPLIIGALVHKFVGGPPLNLNRMLAAANVPLIRI